MRNGTRRIPRFLLAATLGVIGALSPATAAFADDGPWYAAKSSPCSTVISSKTGGGQGTAYIHYDAYRASYRKYVIEWADSWAANFWVCNGDYQVTPYRIRVTLEFQFSGYNLSCTGGFNASYPGGVGISYSCTASGSSVSVKFSTQCAQYSSSCRIDMGYMEVLANTGGSFYDGVSTRTSVWVTNVNGNAVAWSTPYV